MRKIVSFINRFIDLKAGFVTAFFMGGSVFLINYYSTGLVVESIIAALKQWVYTLFFSGAVLKTCEIIVRAVRPRKTAIFMAAVLPFVATIILVYGLHNLRGTPKPLESTLPTLIVILGTVFWAFRKRSQFENEVTAKKLHNPEDVE